MAHAANDAAESNRESETEDGALPRPPVDVRRYDQETPGAEEEAETLLTGTEAEAERTAPGEEEEGGPRSDSAESSGHSSEVDLARLGETQVSRKTKRRRWWCGFAVVDVLIVLAFLALLYGAWRVSKRQIEKDDEKGQADAPGVSLGGDEMPAVE
ncbi:hypothetical protein LTR53_014262 [Teratosphaeriaceae sp. CCFEE 6253]|nr:hypothetical protein LTR53_014262 [Teratosphaeriaceae sp. CCFEE 6253]